MCVCVGVCVCVCVCACVGGCMCECVWMGECALNIHVQQTKYMCSKQYSLKNKTLHANTTVSFFFQNNFILSKRMHTHPVLEHGKQPLFYIYIYIQPRATVH